MRADKFVRVSIVLLFGFLCFPAKAVWFEASGQAVIHNGQKDAARQQATQEAIKQALLFSGASVKSIQSLANGLLKDDRFEIRASGEVNNIQLIDEIYHDGVVTVSIRADIFPQEALCTASDYKKNIVTSWYDIRKRQQAAVGNLYDFGKTLAERMQLEAQRHAQFTLLNNVQPYYLSPANSEKKALAFNLAQKTNAQYVLFGEILEFAVETSPAKSYSFWGSEDKSRQLTLALSLFDGTSGEMVYQDQHSISAAWTFPRHTNIDSNSNNLWESSFGQATDKLIQTAVQTLDEAVSCLPAVGRVMNVVGESLNINLGKLNGVKQGDKLTLFQVNQFFDSQSMAHRQFQLHPEMVMVKQVYAETATVISVSGTPLANIQPNDFVARR